MQRIVRKVFQPVKVRDTDRGFTLIEMLVVTALMAVLAGVIILAIVQFIGRGHDQAAAVELHNIDTAVAIYIHEHGGTIPADTDALINAGYLAGTPHGTYTIDQDTGEVTQTDYP